MKKVKVSKKLSKVTTKISTHGSKSSRRKAHKKPKLDCQVKISSTTVDDYQNWKDQFYDGGMHPPFDGA